MRIGQAIRNAIRRDWISPAEGRLTYVQFFGFVLITIGLLFFVSISLPSKFLPFLPPEASADSIAVTFFIVMLGVAFAFPELLQDQSKDMSTMRIVVFMFANVICMLMLRSGWTGNSLEDIHLDGYWVAIIGFLFGAKVTQAFMENASSFFQHHGSTNEVPGHDVLSNEDILNRAYDRYEELRKALPIRGILPPAIESVQDGGDTKVMLVVRYEGTAPPTNAPHEIAVANYSVPVLYKPFKGPATTHGGACGAGISNMANTQDFPNHGTLGCLVEGIYSQVTYALSCYHVMRYDHQWDVFNPHGKETILDAQGDRLGTLVGGFRDDQLDVAIATLNDQGSINTRIEGMPRLSGTRAITTNDVSIGTKVILKGRNMLNGPKEGVIYARRISQPILYWEDSGTGVVEQVQRVLRELIAITESSRAPKTLTGPGDSGTIVEDHNGFALGMVVAGDDEYTYVMPLDAVLSSYTLKLKPINSPQT